MFVGGIIRSLLKIKRRMEKNLVEKKKSGSSFAKGQPIGMIICKRSANLDDHLQKAGSSG